MSGNENGLFDLVLILPHAALFFIGLPFMILLIADVVTQGGVGLPESGVWPRVAWAAALGGYQFVIACVAVHMAVVLGAGLAAGRALKALGIEQEDPKGAAMLAVVTAVHWVIVCGSLMWYVRRRGGTLRAIGLTGARWGRAAAGGLRMFLAAMPAVLFLMIVFYMVYAYTREEPPALHPVLRALQEAREPWAEAVLLAGSVLVLPFFEELFWRGIVQTSLIRSGSPALAIVLSAVLFAASHPWEKGGWTAIPALGVLGLGLGLVFYRTGSLAAPVAMHAVFNLYNVLMQMGEPTLKGWLKGLFG